MDTWGAERCAEVHCEEGTFVARLGRVSGSGATEAAARSDLGWNLGVAWRWACGWGES